MTRDEAINGICNIRNNISFEISKVVVNKIYDDFESRTCDNCKWFDIDESIDPNNHFGWCNNKESCCVSNICTLSFGCNEWESKDEPSK